MFFHTSNFLDEKQNQYGGIGIDNPAALSVIAPYPAFCRVAVHAVPAARYCICSFGFSRLRPAASSPCAWSKCLLVQCAFSECLTAVQWVSVCPEYPVVPYHGLEFFIRPRHIHDVVGLQANMRKQQVNIIRLKLIKIAARAVRSARYITFKLCGSCPYKKEFYGTPQNIRRLTVQLE